MTSSRPKFPSPTLSPAFAKHVSSLEPLKGQMPHALNSKTLRAHGIKDGSAKTMACKAGGLHVHCEAFPDVHRQSMSRDQGIPAISRGFHKTLRAKSAG